MIKIYQQDISYASREATVYALANIGPEAKAAIPLLLPLATNSDFRLRYSATYALAEIRDQSE